MTPAHLLCGRRLLSLSDSNCYTDPEEEYGISREHLTRRLVHLNKLLGDFWNRWQTEYLLELRDSHRHVGKTSDKESVSVGDVSGNLPKSMNSYQDKMGTYVVLY